MFCTPVVACMASSIHIVQAAAADIASRLDISEGRLDSTSLNQQDLFAQ